MSGVAWLGCGQLANIASQVAWRVQVEEGLAARILPNDLTAVEFSKQAPERPAA
jgi:hypothetical protein|tara:strand:+ start:484 stop:645 length:162 start_codon:yes stop_codon:yes gene_type:complete